MQIAQIPQFRVATVAATDKPQTVAYLALHQDYSSDYVTDTHLSEDACGKIVVDRLLKGGRGHYGPLEHASITLNIRCDHATLMQLTRHRMLSFDVQSMRYTSDHVKSVGRGETDVEDVFYIRPAGTYKSRDGEYVWDERRVQDARYRMKVSCGDYADDLDAGIPPEHSRHYLATCLLQNCIATGNLRSWLHVLEVRNKANAQMEIQAISDLIHLELLRWAPDVVSWWGTNRASKGLLAP